MNKYLKLVLVLVLLMGLGATVYYIGLNNVTNIIIVLIICVTIITSIALIILGSSLTNMMSKDPLEQKLPKKCQVTKIKVDDVLTSDETSSDYHHQATLNLIDNLIANKQSKGIILYVDSPGGGVYESDQLLNKLVEYQKTGRFVYALFGSLAASGGYYISCQANKVYASNRNTLVGSIGVYFEHYNITKLLKKFGVRVDYTYRGENKLMGSPFNDMSKSDREIFETLASESYEDFKEVVKIGRNFDDETMDSLATGAIFSARQALNYGLIDGIISESQLVTLIEKELNMKPNTLKIYEPDLKTVRFKGLRSYIKSFNQSKDIVSIKEVLNKPKGINYLYHR